MFVSKYDVLLLFTLDLSINLTFQTIYDYDIFCQQRYYEMPYHHDNRHMKKDYITGKVNLEVIWRVAKWNILLQQTCHQPDVHIFNLWIIWGKATAQRQNEPITSDVPFCRNAHNRLIN